jgi:hypothetical protein
MHTRETSAGTAMPFEISHEKHVSKWLELQKTKGGRPFRGGKAVSKVRATDCGEPFSGQDKQLGLRLDGGQRPAQSPLRGHHAGQRFGKGQPAQSCGARAAPIASPA